MESVVQMEAASMEPRRYWLPLHVYACRTDDSIVFLDLKQDKYVAISADELISLHGLVEGWPSRSCGQHRHGSTCAKALRAADVLVSRGLLTPEQKQGRSAAAAQVKPLEMERPGQRPLLRPTIRFRHIALFVAAYVWAALLLRTRSLNSIVRVARALKVTHGSRSTQAERRAAAERASIFRRLRPWFFRERNNCLLSALALWRFLLWCGLASTWIIGVKTAPFAAHSWVQCEGLLLDGDAAEVDYYTPILAV